MGSCVENRCLSWLACFLQAADYIASHWSLADHASSSCFTSSSSPFSSDGHLVILVVSLPHWFERLTCSAKLVQWTFNIKKQCNQGKWDQHLWGRPINMYNQLGIRLKDLQSFCKRWLEFIMHNNLLNIMNLCKL